MSWFTSRRFATNRLLVIRRMLLLASLVALARSSDGDDTASCPASSTVLKSPVLPVPTITLRNGVQLPVLSLGTAHVVLDEKKDASLPRFMGFLPEQTYRQIQLALESGIRSFDAGRIYRSHRAIGHVLGEWFRLGQLEERNEIFITTKVFHGSAERVGTRNSHLYNLEDLTPAQVTMKVTQEIEESLVDLGVGYIDLMLLHWPASALDQVEEREEEGVVQGNDDPRSTATATTTADRSTANRQRRLAAWEVLEEFYEKGWLRAIGVSNFSELHLQQLQQDHDAKNNNNNNNNNNNDNDKKKMITPMVNQIESSLSVHYPKIVEYCQQHGIVLQSFSPLKRGDFDESSLVQQIILAATKKTAAQLSLRYLYQKGYAIIFLSTNAQRMVSNHDIFLDFNISQQDMEILSSLPREDGNWGLPTPYDLE